MPIAGAMALLVAGCQTTGGNGGTNFTVDPNSDLIGTWLFQNGTAGGAPQSANGRAIQIDADGDYLVLDNQQTPIERGTWGVNGAQVRFTPTQQSPDALWIGTFTPTWEIQGGTILRLSGQDGSMTQLIHFYERQ